MAPKDDKIIVRGARMHNLKNIDVEIPRDKMTVITGLSGSGKSTLAFDTIYAEGQRRYVESLSAYARQFLELMQKPEVDSIDGLSPAISIDQKTTSRNPRSTVGTVTEIYDYLRLLFAKVGEPHCPICNEPIQRQTHSEIIDHIAEMKEGTKIMLMAPIVRDKKGEHRTVFDQIKKDGFVRYRLDGEVYSVLDEIEIDPKKKHTIEIVVDRLTIEDLGPKFLTLPSGKKIEEANPNRTRLADSLELALKFGNGLVTIFDVDKKKNHDFSEHFTCANHPEVSLPEIEPRIFSFNSPHGACETCHGLGTKLNIDVSMVIPNGNLTLAEGAIHPWSATTSKLSWYCDVLEQVAKKHKFSMQTPIKDIKQEHLDIILHGDSKNKYKINFNGDKFTGEYETNYEGVVPNLERRYNETDSDYIRKKIEQYMTITECGSCKGQRLKPESLSVFIGEKNIIELTQLSIEDALKFFNSLKFSASKAKISEPILKEVLARLGFLKDVGLSYLTLSRAANSLSGGEAQRIRLATQIGSKLHGVLYVLDEPSIGLHQKDNDRLLNTLISLRDIGNTVIIVEHDEDIIRAADYVLDVGPGAGKHGGQVIAQGTPAEIMKDKNSITGQYLSGGKKIEIPKVRRKGNGKSLMIKNAHENNLKNVSVEIPLGIFCCVTGVSGSGKSSLVNHILVKSLLSSLNHARTIPGKHDEISGTEHLDKIINIDQSPIGRTPRSNPATYTGVFTDIRDLFATTPEAKLRGYKAGRFSFNVKGGRCEACAGDGMKKIEMHFLPDIYVPCEVCKGARYNREALEITWRGKNIANVLDMTVSEALEFFGSIPDIKTKLSTLEAVGLGYIHLGQSATTLSGGEAQRIKLANELAKRSTGKTIYVLDEPTTGLHFDDVKRLLHVLDQLVESGNTVVVIEHNLDMIKTADWIIDLGPEGGLNGGEIVAIGTPEEIAKNKTSFTGSYLKKMLEN
jgi:excinuclease ABC subunit A